MTGLLVSSPSASRKLQGDSSLAPASSQVELVVTHELTSSKRQHVHLGVLGDSSVPGTSSQAT